MKKSLLFAVILVSSGLLPVACGETPQTVGSDMPWSGRIVSLTYNGLSLYQKITPQQVNKYVKGYADKGVVIMNDSGCFFRFNYQDQIPLFYKRDAMMAKACHDNNVKFLEHLDFTIPGYRGFPEMEKHLDWLQVDSRYGYRYLWFCFNNPGFQQAMLDYLKEYVKHVDADIFMIDEVCFCHEYSCGCKYCREKFHKDTGLEMPYDCTDPFWTDNSLPAKLAYTRWRIKNKGDFEEKIRTELKKIKPDLKFVTYSTDFLSSYGYRLGSCMWESSKSMDMTGCEVWGRVASFESYFSILQTLKNSNAIANFWHKPAWSIPYGAYDCAILTAAMCNMSRTLIYGESPFIQWPFKMDFSRSRIIADVAVLGSFQTRNTSRSPEAQCFPVNGWLRTLLENDIQFDMVLDQDLSNSKVLDKYKVLVLASASALSNGQIEGIEKFVKQGGKLIFSYNSALSDENAQPRKTSWLQAAMGITVQKTGKEQFRIESAYPLIQSSTQTFNVPLAEIDQKTLNSQCKVLAYAKTKNLKAPLILSCPYGNGELIYIAAEFAMLNYPGEVLKGEPYQHQVNPVASRLMRTLVTPKSGFTVSTDAPEKLIMYAYYENATPPRIVLHFLNMTGHKFRNGQKITGITSIPYPEVRDVTVKIKTDLSPNKVWLGNLDLETGVPVKFKYENRTLELNIPGEYLRKYAVVFAE